MADRVVIEVSGIVQGVGFRPSVHRLATSRGLCGNARNSGAHLVIDLEGDSAALASFLDRLPSAVPPRAAIDAIVCRQAEPAHYEEFVIGSSDTTRNSIKVSP